MGTGEDSSQRFAQIDGDDKTDTQSERTSETMPQTDSENSDSRIKKNTKLKDIFFRIVFGLGLVIASLLFGLAAFGISCLLTWISSGDNQNTTETHLIILYVISIMVSINCIMIVIKEQKNYADNNLRVPKKLQVALLVTFIPILTIVGVILIASFNVLAYSEYNLVTVGTVTLLATIVTLIVSILTTSRKGLLYWIVEYAKKGIQSKLFPIESRAASRCHIEARTSSPYSRDYNCLLNELKENAWEYDFGNESGDKTFVRCTEEGRIKGIMEAVETWHRDSGASHENDELAETIMNQLITIDDTTDMKKILCCRDVMNSFQISRYKRFIADSNDENLRERLEHVAKYLSVAHTIGNFVAIPEYIVYDGEEKEKKLQNSKGGTVDRMGFRDSEYVFLRSVQNGSKHLKNIDFKSYTTTMCLETYCAQDKRVERFNKKVSSLNDPKKIVRLYRKEFSELVVKESAVVVDPSEQDNWYLASAIRIEARGRYIMALLDAHYTKK